MQLYNALGDKLPCDEREECRLGLACLGQTLKFKLANKAEKTV